MNKKINLILGLIFAVFLISNVAATITCNVKDITKNDHIYCFYSSDKYDILFPKIIDMSNGLVAKIDSPMKNVEPNSKYSISIFINWEKSRAGTHYLEIAQGNETQKIIFNVIKEVDKDINYDINYFDDYALITLKIPNNTNKNIPAIIKINNVPNFLMIKKTKYYLALTKNSTTELKIKAYYLKAKTGTLNINIKTPNYSKNIGIAIKKQNIPYNNKKTPLFTLANANTLIAINIVLFIVAIVLFTMFIGRLGKIIVK